MSFFPIFASARGLTTGVGTFTPPTPTGMVDGDIVVLVLSGKPDTFTHTTPAGWTVLGSVSGGGGTAGVNAGPVKQSVLYRVKDSSWSLIPSITTTGGNSISSNSLLYKLPPGASGWATPTFAGGVFGVAALTLNCASTLTSNPDLQPGDRAAIVYCFTNDPMATSIDGLGASAPGVTSFGKTALEYGFGGSSAGNKHQTFSYGLGVFTGSSTGAPTTQLTHDTPERGTVVMIRLRAIGSTSPPTVVPHTTVGTTTWTPPEGVTKYNALVVAGGGGGGLGSTTTGSGGGGGGGLQWVTDIPCTPGTPIDITVGAGGAVNSNGGNSVCGSITSLGGGRGGNGTSLNGGNGGCGGGAGSTTVSGTAGVGTVGQGKNGSAGFGSSTTSQRTGGGGGSSLYAAYPGESGWGGDGGLGSNYADYVGDSYGLKGEFSAGGGGSGTNPGRPNGSDDLSSGGRGGINGGVAGTSGMATSGGGGGSGAAGGSGAVLITYGPSVPATAQVSREHVEALTVGSPSARVSREHLESLVSGSPSANLSQFYVEALFDPLTLSEFVYTPARPESRVGWWDGNVVKPLKSPE